MSEQKACCPDWTPGNNKIDAFIVNASLRAGKDLYDGKPFKFCPWCGKEWRKSASEFTNHRTDDYDPTPPAPDLVEKVARAIFVNYDPKPFISFDEMVEHDQEMYRTQAKAAIAALQGDVQVATEIVKDLAAWSKKYPRGHIYGMGRKDDIDGQLIAIEDRAIEYVATLEQARGE